MTATNSDTTVLVTGVSGFVGLHTALALLEQGYRLRGKVRSEKRASSLREALPPHTDKADRLGGGAQARAAV